MDEKFVVYRESTDEYLRPFGNANGWIFGTLEQAEEFPTLAAAQAKAVEVGGGTVGTSRPTS